VSHDNPQKSTTHPFAQSLRDRWIGRLNLVALALLGEADEFQVDRDIRISRCTVRHVTTLALVVRSVRSSVFDIDVPFVLQTKDGETRVIHYRSGAWEDRVMRAAACKD